MTASALFKTIFIENGELCLNLNDRNQNIQKESVVPSSENSIQIQERKIKSVREVKVDIENVENSNSPESEQIFPMIVKGQLLSNGLFGVFKSIKKPTKF